MQTTTTTKYQIEWRDQEGHLYSATVDSYIAANAMIAAFKAAKRIVTEARMIPLDKKAGR